MCSFLVPTTARGLFCCLTLSSPSPSPSASASASLLLPLLSLSLAHAFLATDTHMDHSESTIKRVGRRRPRARRGGCRLACSPLSGAWVSPAWHRHLVPRHQTSTPTRHLDTPCQLDQLDTPRHLSTPSRLGPCSPVSRCQTRHLSGVSTSKTSGIGKDSCVRVTLDSTFLVFN